MADTKKKTTTKTAKPVKTNGPQSPEERAPELESQRFEHNQITIPTEDREDHGEAVGILEVFGLSCAFMAADAGCKAANVTLENFDKNKPANADALPVPLLVTIKFRGSVEDVTAAVEAGMEVAKAKTGVVQHHVIPRPTEDCRKMLKLNAFDKN